MRNLTSSWVFAVMAATILSTSLSCNSTSQQAEDRQLDSAALVDSVGSVGVNPLSHGKDFPDATLTINELTSERVGDSARVTVKYGLNNFQLTEQTDHDHHMANSHEGQHIHFILNDEPYVALYSPEHSFTVALGSEHTVLSFLSRSFHESIKLAAAYQLVKFRVHDNGSLEQLPVTEEAALFYSRPKGDYEGTDTTAVLLDFYIVNTTLSGEGNQVKAHINDQEFLLNQWTPYEILNLSPGESTIRLTLVDKDGNTLSGDHVSVEGKMRINR